MAKSNVYYFNPTCEMAIANGSFSYMPPLLLQEMERDLAILPFVFTTENDFLIAEEPPSTEFIQYLQNLGFKLPAFCKKSELEQLPNQTFNEILPWGWSPAAHFSLKNLKLKCEDSFKSSPLFEWRIDYQSLFERLTSLKFLKNVLLKNPRNWLIAFQQIGTIVTNYDEIEMLLNSDSALVLKAPISSSGRGIQTIRNGKLNVPNKQWISGILKQQKYLIAEPYLDKLIDLSFQFSISENSQIKYLGFSIFETNSNGQYKATLLHPKLDVLFPEVGQIELAKMIEETAEIIANELEFSIYAKWHRGFLGIDAMIFNNNNQLFMQPCIEINSRMNMGIVSKFIENKIHPKSNGKFVLFYGNQGEYSNLVRTQLQVCQCALRDGKIFSGFFPLAEPDTKKKFGAYISLGDAK